MILRAFHSNFDLNIEQILRHYKQVLGIILVLNQMIDPFSWKWSILTPYRDTPVTHPVIKNTNKNKQPKKPTTKTITHFLSGHGCWTVFECPPPGLFPSYGRFFFLFFSYFFLYTVFLLNSSIFFGVGEGGTSPITNFSFRVDTPPPLVCAAFLMHLMHRCLIWHFSRIRDKECLNQINWVINVQYKYWWDTLLYH